MNTKPPLATEREHLVNEQAERGANANAVLCLKKLSSLSCGQMRSFTTAALLLCSLQLCVVLVKGDANPSSPLSTPPPAPFSIVVSTANMALKQPSLVIEGTGLGAVTNVAFTSGIAIHQVWRISSRHHNYIRLSLVKGQLWGSPGENLVARLTTTNGAANFQVATLVSDSTVLIRPFPVTVAENAPTLEIHGNMLAPYIPDYIDPRRDPKDAKVVPGYIARASFRFNQRLFEGYNYTQEPLSNYTIRLKLQKGSKWAELGPNEAYRDLQVSAFLVEDGGSWNHDANPPSPKVTVARIVKAPIITTTHTVIHPTTPTITLKGSNLDADDVSLEFDTGVKYLKDFTFGTPANPDTEIKLTLTQFTQGWLKGAYGSRPLRLVRYTAHRGTWDVQIEIGVAMQGCLPSSNIECGNRYRFQGGLFLCDWANRRLKQLTGLTYNKATLQMSDFVAMNRGSAPLQDPLGILLDRHSVDPAAPATVYVSHGMTKGSDPAVPYGKLARFRTNYKSAQHESSPR